jgi:tetratricopeptide (TPR) repeat protein
MNISRITYPLSLVTRHLSLVTRHLSLVIALLCIASGVCASALAMDKNELEQRFGEGNAAYEKGDYGKAIQQYARIATAGKVSGPLYFNLGNAYFKISSVGQAILNYERARRIMPRDADLLANYNFARSMIKGNPPDEKGLWAWKPLKAYSERFTVNELLLMASAVYMAAMVLFIAVLYLPGLAKYILPLAILLMTLASADSVVSWHAVQGIGKSAVVTAAQVESKFGPFDSATKFFTLYEGMGVTVLDTKDDWCKVRRSDGKTGWVKSSAVEII